MPFSPVAFNCKIIIAVFSPSYRQAGGKSTKRNPKFDRVLIHYLIIALINFGLSKVGDVGLAMQGLGSTVEF